MKPKKKKPNPNEKVCERCGNGGFSRKKIFKCRYCGWINGCEEYNTEITRGGIDDR